MKTWDEMFQEMDPENQSEIEVIRERAAMVTELIAIREHKGWTQDELARKVGMKQSAIARFEGGSTMPRMDTVLKIARALGVKMTFMPLGAGKEEAAAVYLGAYA
ncbi:helix-turn-helix domain-containing protein [Paenibacillus sp. LMG 31461]|uniref:Helix-turn-helix domain-containing protein n=1 Tax=Paenibacillus plantarum TaxID=2654975 RepID=A0ABX1XM40_9BACL|nr:helix-turn-helix transcriptional regulator [Paenibacillus plantarum]NOU69597.1 helix-turn-helix domain-containing protein [Paenibacillus plantarum]